MRLRLRSSARVRVPPAGGVGIVFPGFPPGYTLRHSALVSTAMSLGQDPLMTENRVPALVCVIRTTLSCCLPPRASQLTSGANVTWVGESAFTVNVVPLPFGSENSARWRPSDRLHLPGGGLPVTCNCAAVSVTTYRPSGPRAGDAVAVGAGAAAGLFVVVLLLDPHPAKTPIKPTVQTATTTLGCTATATAPCLEKLN